jgi:predicted transcriptional regulator
VGETFPTQIMSHFREERSGDALTYQGEITPQMTNHLGTASSGILTTVMIEAACNALRQHRRGDVIPENITVYYLKPVQMESNIQIKPCVLDVSRRFGKVEVSVYHQEQLVGKAMVTAQIIER